MEMIRRCWLEQPISYWKLTFSSQVEQFSPCGMTFVSPKALVILG